MNKNLIITGGTSGLGRVMVEKLIAEDWQVTILARNEEKFKDLLRDFEVDENQLQFIHCDLADLASVKKAANALLQKESTIDVLCNNAGGYVEEYQKTGDGFELTFQMNHLGHFLLTQSLLDKLIQSKSRIINVSSAAHQGGRLNFDDLDWQSRKYNGMRAYADAKLCNIYFTRELHERYAEEGVSSFALHPGVVNTNFFSDVSGFSKILVAFMKPFMVSPEKGAQTHLYLATEKGIEKHSGKYFVKKKPAKAASQAGNERKSERLWEISEKLVKSSLK